MTQPKRQKTKSSRPLILNFFEALTPVLHAPGQWRNPNDLSRDYYKPEYWQRIAQLAEKGKLHGIFFGDSLSIYGSYKGPHNYEEAAKSGNNFPKNDPTAYLSAMAVVTKNVCFGFTGSTLSEHPYHWARRLATMDLISNGRVGWNVVSSFLPSAGRQLAPDNVLPPKNERYEKTDEYLQVVYSLLLSSWRDDGLVWDRKRSYVSDPDLIREINHDGKYFRVPGPQITEPSPQRMPLVIQAGMSPKGIELGAKHAEVIFLTGFTPQAIAKKISKIKTLAKEKFNRNPDNIKFITLVSVIVGNTEKEAQEKLAVIESLKDLEGIQVQIGGFGFDLSKYDWDLDLRESDEAGKQYAQNIYDALPEDERDIVITRRYLANKIWGASTFIGSASSVADQIEEYVQISGIDGFNFTNVSFPQTFEDIVEILVPELQKRGLAQTEYAVPGGTYREQIYGIKGQTFFPEDHYAYPLRWATGVSKEAFEKQLAEYESTIKEYIITA